MKRLLLIFVALAVLLAACQPAPTVVTIEPDEVECTYVVEEYEPKPPVPPPVSPPVPSPPPPEPEPTPPPPRPERTTSQC